MNERTQTEGLGTNWVFIAPGLILLSAVLAPWPMRALGGHLFNREVCAQYPDLAGDRRELRALPYPVAFLDWKFSQLGKVPWAEATKFVVAGEQQKVFYDDEGVPIGAEYRFRTGLLFSEQDWGVHWDAKEAAWRTFSDRIGADVSLACDG